MSAKKRALLIALAKALCFFGVTLVILLGKILPRSDKNLLINFKFL